jgi:hypothetical protein
MLKELFKGVDKSMLLKLVILHVAVITISNALVHIPVQILGVKLTCAPNFTATFCIFSIGLSTLICRPGFPGRRSLNCGLGLTDNPLLLNKSCNGR